MGRQRGWGAAMTGRPLVRSPGRPAAWRREALVLFWEAIARGVSTVEAAGLVGVSQAVGVRWFRKGGGMPTVTLNRPDFFGGDFYCVRVLSLACSNSAGGRPSQALCRRLWLYQSTHSRVASSTWSIVFHGPLRLISSVL